MDLLPFCSSPLISMGASLCIVGNQCKLSRSKKEGKTNKPKSKKETIIMDVPRDRLGRKKRKIRARESPFSVYSEEEFISRYRLSKDVVRQLVQQYKQESVFRGSKRAGGLSHVDRFCLVLRYFATGSFYYMTGDSQKVSTSAVCRAVKDVASFFYRNRHRFIKWPQSFEEKLDLALKTYRHKVKVNRGGAEMEVEQGTPFVFGYVDGTHVPIKCPTDNESAFVNRNGYHSINTTVVCDYDKRIIFVDPRWPGSVHDAYALSCSPVGDEIEEEAWGDFFLLADSGYALRRNIFTPFKDEEGPKERAFNTWHRRSRVRVEQCIGILKQRWRILDSSAGYLRHEPARSSIIITACACLHNVALDHGIRLVEDLNDQWTPQRAPVPQPRPPRRNQLQENRRSKQFRQNYANKYF